MAKIRVLDHQTIDKIAAGEVVERPASVVKELVENAIDAGADAITVEIKEGGISFVRVTDNGEGIERSQIANAFLRHATSKISTAEDLTELVSLGFRGEALASIAAVSMVEIITKTRDELMGSRYCIEGGIEKGLEDVGAPEGTTIIVRNLFYNTLPRKKFLKQPQTEGAYVADLMEHLAMSHPDISFKFVLNGNNRFYTTGNGDLKEILYRIYGREISEELFSFTFDTESFSIRGLLGKPVINRSNRNCEFFYINGRYIRSTLLSKAVEEGYREYLMQHKFPFCVLHFQIDTSRIDVNVHPTKMEVRISDAPAFYETIKNAVYDALHRTEMIPKVTLVEEKEKGPEVPKSMPEPFESRRIASVPMRSGAIEEIYRKSRPQEPVREELTDTVAERKTVFVTESAERKPVAETSEPVKEIPILKPQQLELFDDKLLSAKAKEQYIILGQLFETYWLISYQDKFLIMDQHAAHEKVKYERFMKRYRQHEMISQTINPPVIVSLDSREALCYRNHQEDFQELGFSVEDFGGTDIAIRGVPMDLYGYREQELFREVLDELVAENVTGTPESIRIRIATMACKAAVKGNMKMSLSEVESLLDELMTLENPYNCPHGRPTIISMSKYEIEKKFKRIVT